MRHMETYMGTKLKEWDCGLKKRSKKQLRFLRVKYCTSLLAAEHNGHNEDNIIAAKEHYERSCASGPIDVEMIVATYQSKDDEVSNASK